MTLCSGFGCLGFVCLCVDVVRPKFSVEYYSAPVKQRLLLCAAMEVFAMSVKMVCCFVVFFLSQYICGFLIFGQSIRQAPEKSLFQIGVEI